MLTGYKYQPFRFFLVIYLVTWGSWFTAAYLSYRPGAGNGYFVLLLPGLVAPFAIAAWMILSSKSPDLKKNFRQRLFNLHLIRPSSLIPMIVIMVCHGRGRGVPV